MHLSISRSYIPLIFHVLVCVFVCLRASFCLFVLSVVCHFKCFSFYYVVLCIVCAFLLLMPEKVSSVLKTLSLCNCHNFIFSLPFCGILAFTLSCLSLTLNSSPNSSFKPVPIALQSQSLNKFLMVSLVSWLSYFLLCYLIRCVYLMFFYCSLL